MQRLRFHGAPRVSCACLRSYACSKASQQQVLSHKELHLFRVSAAASTTFNGGGNSASSITVLFSSSSFFSYAVRVLNRSNLSKRNV